MAPAEPARMPPGRALLSDLPGAFATAGFCVLPCPGHLAPAVRHALRLGPELLRDLSGIGSDAPTERGLVVSYKQQGSLKERVQVRSRAQGSTAVSVPHEEPAAAAIEVVRAVLETMEALALQCFAACCEELSIPAGAALRRFGEERHALLLEGQAATGAGGDGRGRRAAAGKSVLNLYHYFNEGEGEPCREHADPGLVTILCRSSNSALEARPPRPEAQRPPWVGPGDPAAYEGAWLNVEEAMDATSGRCGGQELMLLAVPGETLERLSGGRFPACRHRVVRAPGPRFNIAYELRPRTPVWVPWAQLMASS